MIEHVFVTVKRVRVATFLASDQEGTMGGTVELRLLGPVELAGPEGPIRLGGPHRRAIVALLALRAGETVTTEQLVDGLWGDASPINARKSLSTQVAQLRPLLAHVDARLEHTGAGYSLDLPPDRLDLARFDRAEAEADQLAGAGHALAAVERLRAGLACWHGPPLADLGHFPFAARAVTWLQHRHLAASDRLTDLLLAAGDPDAAVVLLESLVEEHPYDERRWAQLVRALHATGRRGDALQAYQRARHQLGEGLGLDPGRELRDVERDVLAGAVATRGADGAGSRREPFVGRTVQLERLDRALERAERGATQVVAVLGEPGIGKTELLNEHVHRLRARGVTALLGTCEPSQSVPLQSLLAALDPLVSDPPPGAPAIDPDLLDLLRGPTAPEPIVEPTGLDLRRFRAIRALGRTLGELAATGPVVVVLDDIQWLDPFTAAVLDHVCNDAPAQRLLIVTGATTTPSTWGEVEERLVRLERAVPLERLRLRPLSPAEVRALVRTRAVGTSDLDLLAAQIHEASGGNALFATQLARAAADGQLPAAVPQALDAMCRSRVAAVSDDARLLLEAGAVLGMELDLRLLALVLDRSQDEVDRLVPEAVSAGLLTGSEQVDHHRFAHGVVRQVVYDDLPDGRRRRLHARAADAIEVAGLSDPGAVAVVAHHLERARPLVSDDRVRAALERAGRVAAQQGALEAGLRLLDDALALAVAPEDRASIELARGIIGLASGDWAAAADIERASRVARDHDRWDLVADAAIAVAQVQSSPSPDRSRAMAAHLEEVVAHLAEAEVARRALLQCWRAHLLVNVEPDRSCEAVAIAEGLAAQAPDLQITVAMRYVRLRQAESRGDDPLACLEEALALAADPALADDPRLASFGHVAAQAARLRAGHFDDCRAEQGRYLQHAIDVHQRAIELQLVAVDVALAFATGSVGDAESASAALCARLDEAGAEAAQAVRFIQRLFTAREREPDPGWRRVLTAVASGPLHSGDQAFLAAGLLAADAEDEARTLIERFVAQLDGLRRDWAHDAAVAVAAEVVSDLGLVGPHVQQLYDALLPVRGQVVTLTSVVMVLGRADRYLGRLAALDGHLDLAIDHLAAARRADDAAGSGLWSGWAAQDEAVVRLQRAAPGDREVAEELIDLALARAQWHGSDRLTRAASR